MLSPAFPMTSGRKLRLLYLTAVWAIAVPIVSRFLGTGSTWDIVGALVGVPLLVIQLHNWIRNEPMITADVRERPALPDHRLERKLYGIMYSSVLAALAIHPAVKLIRGLLEQG